ncbi:MAG: HPP family protein, partial [Gammaproteobacteria bacterium]|nr:HPP family protein [Gammaproteobacteria bacterium]
MKSWRDLIGLSSNTTSHIEKYISGLGAFCGIYGIWLVSSQFLDPQVTPLIVASMGASAVLLYGVPHGQLSQPWNLCVGHFLSALAGVSCAMLIPDEGLAAGAAVGLAVFLMHYTQSIHPPGGATALFAVIGGPSVHQLGFGYVITPIMLNVLVILGVAIIFNYPFRWRRYPEAITPPIKSCAQTHLRHNDLQYALEQLDAVSTITEHELAELFTLAEKHALDDHLAITDIHIGRYYSNGRLGSEWSVRHLIDGPEDSTHEDDQLVYKVIAGNLRHMTGSASRDELAKWARYEVIPDESRHHGWKRVK